VNFWIDLSTRILFSTTLPASVQAYSSSITKTVSVPKLSNGMDYCKLGSSDLEVSKVCMGTMTFGNQNTQREGVEQLMTAFEDYGVNFLDTAEMYPVPTNPTTCGDTDRTVAEFLRQMGPSRRDGIVLATKVCGRSERMTWMPRAQPNTPAALSREQILHSVDSSLKRLNVNYIDLLQLHWPDRYTGGLFGQPDFTATQLKEDYYSFEEQLGALQTVVEEGKVRYVGVSNETPFGVCSMVGLANNHPTNYPKIVSIQNSYSLVVRKDFEAGLAEACYHHQVGLLPYSPLAGGSLSGKYRNPERIPATSRLKLFPGFMDRYLGSLNEAAVNAYSALAEEVGLTPTQLALSWCYHREYVTSTIIGATTMEQLHENIQAYDVRLDDSTKARIGEIYKKYTDPTKI
jgi:aryl-alcohol dehydrogenase-like predicted oxidoreductase